MAAEEKKIMSVVILEFIIFFGGMAVILTFCNEMCRQEMDDD